jgi:hypothetical protein
MALDKSALLELTEALSGQAHHRPVQLTARSADTCQGATGLPINDVQLACAERVIS